MASDSEFRTPLRTDPGPYDLTFRCHASPLPAIDPAQDMLVFESPIRLESGAPYMALYRLAGRDLLRFSEVVDFEISEDAVTAHLLDPEYAFMVEIHLLGSVLSYWFERRGLPMLHASAVAVEGQAAVFMATNRAGKSSLAAAVMTSGGALLADDLAGLRVEGERVEALPGWPCMRFWPDQASHFGRPVQALPLAHPGYAKRMVPVGGEFGAFCDRPCPVGAIYLPERRAATSGDPRVDVSEVPRRRGIMELVRGSFLPQTLEAAGFAARRMALFARALERVPVKRLVYPDGVEFLPAVAEAIKEDLAREQRPLSGASTGAAS